MAKMRAKPVRKKVAARKKVRKSVKRASRKSALKKKPSVMKRVSLARKAGEAALEKIGEVTHYFPHVKAAAVKILKDSIKQGDQIYIKGHTTDFKEKIRSLQLDRAPIKEGRKGEEVGLLVKSRVRIGDSVYRI